ncbi:cellular nucleic acid-binding protein [Stylonychia lemnae]|uniref:Cellular nucleic acid-binding protein n=1 Tax=Stylonychia lemnae TaxID=5949 RepID=A0A078ABJ5_STYLE|nr:cellular nucleic acid-binding protein [Stylonychia lemnae]|eukprot:CDW79670.1 cellular nucleic acid-binding protein [Stylonychia lemnae]
MRGGIRQAGAQQQNPEKKEQELPKPNNLELMRNRYPEKQRKNQSLRQNKVPKVDEIFNLLYQTQRLSEPVPSSEQINERRVSFSSSIDLQESSNKTNLKKRRRNSSNDQNLISKFDDSSQKRLRINLEEESKIQPHEKVLKVSVNVNTQRSISQQILKGNDIKSSQEMIVQQQKSQNCKAYYPCDIQIAQNNQRYQQEDSDLELGEIRPSLKNEQEDADMIGLKGIMVKQGMSIFYKQGEEEEENLHSYGVRKFNRNGGRFLGESDRKTQAFIELMKSNKSSTIRPCPYDVILIDDEDYKQASHKSNKSSQELEIIDEKQGRSNHVSFKQPLRRFFNTHVRQVRCKNCNNLGHTKSQCTEPLKETQTLCLFCRQPGHLDLNCKLKQESCNRCLGLGHKRNKCPTLCYPDQEFEYHVNSIIYLNNEREDYYYLEEVNNKYDLELYECIQCGKKEYYCQCKPKRLEALKLKTDLIVCQKFDCHQEFATVLRTQGMSNKLQFKIKEPDLDIIKSFGLRNQDNQDSSSDEIMEIDQDSFVNHKQQSQPQMSSQDLEDIFMVPEGHQYDTIYCQGCGGQNHPYNNCDNYLLNRGNQSRPNNSSKHYDISSYSGSNPNKEAKRARKFDQAQERISQLANNRDLLLKLQGNSELLATSQNVDKLSFNSTQSSTIGSPDCKASINQQQLDQLQQEYSEIFSSLYSPIPCQINPVQQQQAIQPMNQPQRKPNLWSNSHHKQDQIEMSLQNRMALNYWK